RSKEQILLTRHMVQSQQMWDRLHHLLFAFIAGCFLTGCVLLFLLRNYILQSRQWHDLRKAREIEERERESHSLFDSMPQLAFTALPNGYVNFFNAEVYAYTGLSYDELKGNGWSKVLDAAQLDAVKKRRDYSLRTGTRFETTL